MPRPEKLAVVEEIREKLAASDATVLTEYRGLSVRALAELRGALRGAGTEYKVFKNTLARRAVESSGLDELTADLKTYPQRLVNVRVREKRKLEELPSVAREVRDCEAALGDSGRVLVRFSGTEPLARVMVEAADMRQVEEFTARIAGAIEREIG